MFFKLKEKQDILLPLSSYDIFDDDLIEEPASADARATVVVPNPQEVEISEGTVTRHAHVTHCPTFKFLNIVNV